MTHDAPTSVYDAPCSVLDSEQYKFLAFHTRNYDPPNKWRWHFCETTLRASTEHGHSATITRARLNALIGAGLMDRGPGCADVTITIAGRRAAK